MLAPINYMLDNKSPMDSFFGGMQSVQGIQQDNNTLKQQELVNEQQAATQARKAQMEAELDQLDTTSIEAMRAFNAKYPDMAKGVQTAYDALDAKQKQNTLLNHSRIASLVKNGRPDAAIQMLEAQEEAHRNDHDEQGAQEAKSMADLIRMSPEAAQATLTWGLSIMSPKDVAENYKNISETNIKEDAAPVDRAATQAKTVNERVTAAGGVNKLISTAALTDDPNTFMEMIDTAYDSGLITPEKYNSLLESVSGDGEEVVATLRQLARGNPDIIKELLPRETYTNLGGEIAVTDYDPQTGQFTQKGTMTKTVSPDQVYSSDTNYNIAGLREDGADRRAVLAAETSQANVATQEETKRQNAALAAAQAKEKLELERGEAVKTTINGKVWLFYPKLNKLRAVVNQHGEHLKDASAVKPPNESQANSLMYGERMQTANNILADIESSNKSWDVKGGDVLARVNPKGGSEDFKKYEQAKRNFINAVLRKESGAAIAESEFESANKQYFPQIGDTPDVIAQKAATRKQVTDRMLNNAGPQGTSLISKPVDTSKFVKK